MLDNPLTDLPQSHDSSSLSADHGGSNVSHDATTQPTKPGARMMVAPKIAAVLEQARNRPNMNATHVNLGSAAHANVAPGPLGRANAETVETGIPARERLPFGDAAVSTPEETPGTMKSNPAMPEAGPRIPMDPAPNERRQLRRQRVLKRGSLNFNSGYASYQCTLRNVSADGAMLIMPETGGLPHEFDLVITGEKHRRPARIVWRGRETIGIQFVQSVD